MQYRLGGLICTILTLLIYSGCQEATTRPSPDADTKTRDLLINKWGLESYKENGNDSTGQRSGWVLNFNSDGTYESSSPTEPTMRGRWILNPNDSTFTLIPDNNTEEEKVKIIEISQDRIIYRTVTGNREIVMTAQNKPLFSISGKLRYSTTRPIPSTHRLSVVWEVVEGSKKHTVVWGSGKINQINNTFNIDFNSYPPDSTISQFYWCNGRVGIGYIYLLADTSTKKGAGIQSQKPENVIGVIKDHALVYLFGTAIGKGGTNDTCPWTAIGFKSGFNFGKTVYNTAPPDYFTPVSPLANELLISDNPDDYRQPTWWQ